MDASPNNTCSTRGKNNTSNSLSPSPEASPVEATAMSDKRISIDKATTSPSLFATAASAAAVGGGRRLPLTSPEDATYLSPLVCLMRSQLELFSATPEDVQARASFGSLVQKISVGRVGMRCIHCLDQPAAQQAKGAVSYPASIRVLNQASRNWQRYHWGTCQFIPPSAREEFERLTSGQKAISSRKSQEYWIRRSGEMGLVDTCTATMGRTAASSPDYTSADSSVTKNERTTESEGIYFEDDARKLGLRILRPPIEEKPSSATKKKKKQTRGKGNGKNKSNGAAPKKHKSNKRKNGLDSNKKDSRSGEVNASQVTIEDGTNVSEGRALEEDVPSASVPPVGFPSPEPFMAMNNSLGLANLDVDASLMSDLERLLGEDESGISTAGGNMFDTHAPADEFNETGGPTQADIGIDSTSERDVQLLSTLRATREMVRSLRERYNGAPATGRQIAAELHSLGEALYRTLAGEDSISAVCSNDERSGLGDNDENRLSKRERRRDEDQLGHTSGTTLQDFGYPTSISIFVQSLIDATDEDAVERFTSLSDVDNDLRLMIGFPNKYLLKAPPEVLTGRLGFPSDLYGLQTQQSKLMNAFESVVVTGEERHGLALISGRSGSGKTSLVETLIKPLSERQGRLIQIKFDKKDHQSLSPIFRALDQYCQDLQGDLDLLDEVGGTVKAALGSFGQILLSLMPNLAALVGEIAHSLPTSDNKERYHLLLSCLQIFVRAISAPSHPTVIFFDDLQWADGESLDLITKLVKDTGTKSCLFVGCYRDNEVQTDHPLLEYLGEISFAGVPMWQIVLERIERTPINELLSDTLHLLPRITAPLSREIHKKTGGNPNFAKQLLQSLRDEQLLQYSPSARRWQWDLAAIRSKNIPDNAVSLLLERMTHYGPDVQRVLQVAALMGRRFDASALKMFESGTDGSGDGSGILAHIDTAIGDGLVCVDKAELRFAHDSIWEAALSLTQITERESMHLLIGRRLLHALSTSSREHLDVHLHLTVDQMNRGVDLIVGHDEKLRLAELNLQVGQRALASASFFEASLYLLQGSVLLSNDDWNGNYRLCLDIFTTCAEAQFAQENYDGAIISANAVIVHGRSLKDKLRAHFTVTTALYTQGKLQESCQQALAVLEELGINFPAMGAPIEQKAVRAELERTERLVLSRSENVPVEPFSSSDSDDSAKLTLRFLYNLCKIFYVSNPPLMALVGCKMIQIIMEGSLTSEASFAFATYANVLCTMGFRDRSAASAQMAMGLLDRFHGEYFQNVILSCNLSIYPYRQPWHACLDLFERASRNAMAVGDIGSALLHQVLYSLTYIVAPTSTLDYGWETFAEYLQSATSSGHLTSHIAIVYSQMLLNLITPSGIQNDTDPTILKGDATNQKDILSTMPQSSIHYKRLVRKADFARLYLAYLFRRHEVVLEMALNVKKHLAESISYPMLELLLEKFYLGLAAYSIARRGDVGDNTADWEAIGNKLTMEMKSLSENDSKWNFEQKYYLLEAEEAFTDGNVEAAATAYDKAIEAAKEHRFINEQALASERAALFYLEHGNIGQARTHMKKSRDLYDAWGAKRKVEDIDSWIGSMD